MSQLIIIYAQLCSSLRLCLTHYWWGVVTAFCDEEEDSGRNEMHNKSHHHEKKERAYLAGSSNKIVGTGEKYSIKFEIGSRTGIIIYRSRRGFPSQDPLGFIIEEHKSLE